MKCFFILVLILLEIVPLNFGKNIETYPEWDIGPQKIPLCLFKTANFIKEHSLPEELVQDSQNDPHFKLSALSMRRPFIIDNGGYRTPKGSITRLEEMRVLDGLTSEDDIENFMKKRSIKWYVVDQSKWANSSISKAPVFECGDYKVYHY